MTQDLSMEHLRITHSGRSPRPPSRSVRSATSSLAERLTSVRRSWKQAPSVYLELVTACAEPPDAVVAFFAAAADTLEQSDYIDISPIGTVAREVGSTDDRLRSAAEHSARLATTVICALEGGFVLGRTRRDANIVSDATSVGRLPTNECIRPVPCRRRGRPRRRLHLLPTPGFDR